MRGSIRVGFCLIATLCYRETHAQAPPLPTATYHSDAMNLDFAYPSSFVNRPEESAKDCVSTPIAAMDMRKGFNIILLRRYDGACVGRDISTERSSVAVNFFNDALKALGKPEVSKSTDYEIGGHMASKVSGAVELKGVKPAGTVVYGVGGCVAVNKKDLVCFVFLSSDCPSLAVLSASSTVKFTDTATAPIIPANLAAGCRSGL